MTDDTARIRTLGHAMAEVRFGIEYGALNERYWHGLDTVLNLVQISAGTLALAGAFAGAGLGAGIPAAVVAVVSGFQLTLHPARRAVDFRDARRRFHQLAACGWAQGLAEVDAQLEQLRADAPQGLRALLKPALNAVHEQLGYEHRAVPLRWREKAALALV